MVAPPRRGLPQPRARPQPLDLRARGRILLGLGRLCADGSYDSSGQSETLTRTLDDLLVQEYEFLTAPRVGLELDVRLTRRFGSRGIRGFVALDYAWDKAFSTTALGNAMRHTARLQLGCAF